jgi:hypothetical protein
VYKFGLVGSGYGVLSTGTVVDGLSLHGEGPDDSMLGAKVTCGDGHGNGIGASKPGTTMFGAGDSSSDGPPLHRWGWKLLEYLEELCFSIDPLLRFVFWEVLWEGCDLDDFLEEEEEGRRDDLDLDQRLHFFRVIQDLDVRDFPCLVDFCCCLLLVNDLFPLDFAPYFDILVKTDCLLLRLDLLFGNGSS